MGYAHYALADGRDAGYAVDDVCNLDGCDTVIDRGLAYLCGATPGGDEYGCGKYFCESHLSCGPVAGAQQCQACQTAYEREHPHSFPAVYLNVDSRDYTVTCRCKGWEATGTDTAVLEELHAEHEQAAERTGTEDGR